MKLRFYSIDIEDNDLFIYDSEKETIKECLLEYILKKYAPDRGEQILNHFDVEYDAENEINEVKVKKAIKEKTEKELLELIEWIQEDLSCYGEDDLRVIEDLSNHKIVFENRTYIFDLEKY